MHKPTLIGKIYYASKDAQSKRYYFEGREIGTNNYHYAHFIEPNFVQVELDTTGTNYIHLQLTQLPVKGVK